MAGAVAAAMNMAESVRKDGGEPRVAVHDASPMRDTPPDREPVQPSRAPSFLGLDQPVPSRPSPESLREKVFSGADLYVEPERPTPASAKILGVVFILAVLGAGWWVYATYLVPAQSGPPQATASTEAPAEPAKTPSADSGASPNPGAATAAATPQTAPDSAAKPPEGPAENAKPAGADTDHPAASATPATAESIDVKREPAAPKSVPKVVPRLPTNAAERAGRADARAGKLPASSPATTPASGDSETLFRKGEAYLYGRGAAENCEEAIKYLKSASAKSSAKARSAFGTMYATGHCVPRDLPSSYRWFALALQADPTNTILEKDLSAIWNQMTPPERQAATKSQ